jgi:hypothetical protein
VHNHHDDHVRMVTSALIADERARGDRGHATLARDIRGAAERSHAGAFQNSAREAAAGPPAAAARGIQRLLSRLAGKAERVLRACAPARLRACPPALLAGSGRSHAQTPTKLGFAFHLVRLERLGGEGVELASVGQRNYWRSLRGGGLEYVSAQYTSDRRRTCS